MADEACCELIDLLGFEDVWSASRSSYRWANGRQAAAHVQALPQSGRAQRRDESESTIRRFPDIEDLRLRLTLAGRMILIAALENAAISSIVSRSFREVLPGTARV